MAYRGGHCSSIQFDKSVSVGGQSVDAGTYSLFTKPNPKEWIIILNRDTTPYGSGFYDYKKDVGRFVVIPSESNRFYETLNLDVEILPNDARIFISWANVQVSFDIQTTTDSEIEELIRTELLTKENRVSDMYTGATEYLFYQRENLSDALKLADFAIELNNNRWGRGLKIKIYERMKLYDDVLQEINEYLQNYKSKDLSEEQQEHILKHLKSEHKRISDLLK